MKTLNTIIISTLFLLQLAVANDSQVVHHPSFNDIQKMNLKAMRADEIRSKIINITVTGDFLRGYRFIMFMQTNGIVEGKNHVGSHHFGKWDIDNDTHVLHVKWDTGWGDIYGRLYEVDGDIHFYDLKTNKWRSVFNKFVKGKQPLTVSK